MHIYIYNMVSENMPASKNFLIQNQYLDISPLFWAETLYDLICCVIWKSISW